MRQLKTACVSRAIALCAGALFLLVPAAAQAAWNQPVDSVVGGPTSRPSGMPDAPSQIVSIGGAPYVAWPQFDGSKWGVRVARFDGSAWQAVGGPPNSAPVTGSTRPSIANINGQPYVAWEGEDQSGIEHIWVARFNGASWEQVGSPLNSTDNEAHRPRITGVAGVPYVTWEDACLELSNPCSAGPTYPHQSVATYRFDGSSWQAIDGGVIPVTAGPNYFAYWPNIADVNGTPYIAWADESADKSTSSVRVYRLAGSSWQPAGTGTPPFPNYAYEPIITGIGGAAYVVAEEQSAGYPGPYRVWVQSFDGTNWQQVGGELSAGSGGTSVGPDITSLNGSPFAVWEQAAGGGKYYIWGAVFDGANWQKLGGQINGTPSVHDIRVTAADVNGIPFVAANRYDGSNWGIRVERLEPDIVASATGVSQTKATLAMQISTFGLPYQVNLQYGKGGNFSAATPATTSGFDRSATGSTLNVSQSVGGLTPQTAYSFRPVSTAGTDPLVVGAPQSFNTLAGITSIRTSRVRIDSRGRVPIRIKCIKTGASCKGSLKLQATLKVRARKRGRRRGKPHNHTYALGKKAFRIRSGKTRVVKVRLGKRWQRYLRGHRRLRARATATIPALQGVAGSRSRRSLRILKSRLPHKRRH